MQNKEKSKAKEKVKKEVAVTEAKPKAQPKQELKEASAVGRHLRISFKKVNRIIKHIRNKSVQEAFMALKFLPNSGARYIEKVLKSAQANAENNLKLNKDALYVKEAIVGPGVIMKRFRAQARGRGVRIEKLTAHISITVAERA